MPATPKKGPRLGKDATHQKAILGGLLASLVAAEGIETTLTRAKVLRPVAEKFITKAIKGGVHNQRQTVAFMRDQEMTSKLFNEIAPRFEGRQGGYLRILKLGPRRGDNAPMARIEFVDA